MASHHGAVIGEEVDHRAAAEEASSPPKAGVPPRFLSSLTDSQESSLPEASRTHLSLKT